MTSVRSVGTAAAASFDAAVAFFGNRVATTLAGKRVLIESDDDSILPILFVAFGGDDGRDEPPFLHATLEKRTLRVRRAGALLPPSDLFFGLDEPRCPYRLSGSTITFRDDDSTQFTLDRDAIIVHETSRWREAVASLLLRAFLHFNDDMIFVHASAAGIDGKGLLFLGREGAGKSTIGLALAAHGHEFLSDEFGCYVPGTHELMPYRRPVGIRPGPCAAAIERALARGGFRALQLEDSLRVDLETLIPLSPQRGLPLHAVVFTDGFDVQPSLRFVDPSRNEVGMLQTLYSSLANASHVQRTFELVRLLSRCRVAYLKIGDPDETAALIEEEFSS